uniref:BTB domain-containing protein n=1 Tax=Meloidogyne javanica TaxID=6303 RepID=A0A915MBJ3_MELJA
MKTIKLKFDWTIEGLKKLHKNLSNNTSYRPIQLTSESFSSPDLPEVSWELRVELKRGEDNINVWLRQLGPNNSKGYGNTKYKIYSNSYASSDSIVDISESTHRFEDREKLVPGNLNLYCEVEINCYDSIDNFKKNYQNIFEKGIFSDCVIKVRDEVIKAHRCILAQNSEVFQKMFEENDVLDIPQNTEITITDASPESVRVMLEFFYTGEIKTISESNVDDLFAMAHKYKVEPLKYECEHFLSSKISGDWIAKPKIGPSGVPVVGHPPFHPCNPNPPDFDGKNILKYCKFICLYKAEILEKACTNYIRVIKNWFLKSKEWEDVKNKYPELAMKFLEIGYLEIGNNTNNYLYNQLLI